VRASFVRQLEVEEDTEDREELFAMRPTFIEHPNLPGEGRCSVCDFAYARYDKNEVARHRGYHRRFLAAQEAGWSPAPEAARSEMHRRAVAVIMNPAACYGERLRAAEEFVAAKYANYACGVLLYDARRLDYFDYFTRRVEDKGLLSQFGDDVAREMRYRYSNRAV
jgi:hypothetical protein